MARVICPACKKAGNVPDQYLGNRIKCPSCGERFLAPTLPPPSKGEIRRTATAPLAERAAAVEIIEVEPPPLVARAQIGPAEPAVPQKKVCMYCGEEIQAVALKCKHCGEILDPTLRAAEEAKAIVRQQQHVAPATPVVNVNNVLTSTVGGIPVSRRAFSRMIPAGFVVMLLGFGISMSTTPGTGAGIIGIGFLFMGAGALVTLARWFMAMFR